MIRYISKVIQRVYLNHELAKVSYELAKTEILKEKENDLSEHGKDESTRQTAKVFLDHSKLEVWNLEVDKSKLKQLLNNLN